MGRRKPALPARPCFGVLRSVSREDGRREAMRSGSRSNTRTKVGIEDGERGVVGEDEWRPGHRAPESGHFPDREHGSSSPWIDGRRRGKSMGGRRLAADLVEKGRRWGSRTRSCDWRRNLCG